MTLLGEGRATGAAGPDASLMASFLETVRAAAVEVATAAGGWQHSRLDVGGTTVHLGSVGPFAHQLLGAFAHRQTAAAPFEIDERSPDGARRVHIDVVASAMLGARLPDTAWTWTETEYRDGHLAFEFDATRRVLVASDTGRGRAVVWFETDHVGAWELAAPLRRTLDRLLAQHGHTMVHAGSIGRDGRAVLLAGPGGSGKSTAVHAALGAGYETVGDDFLVLPADSVTVVESLYRTTRLRASSPRFDASRHEIVDDGFGNDKALVMLDEEYPGQLVSRQQVLAVITPVLTGRPESRLVPEPAVATLRALLPSSLLLADRQPAALSRLVTLAKSVPTYRLEAGTDLSLLLATIEPLLGDGG